MRSERVENRGGEGRKGEEEGYKGDTGREGREGKESVRPEGRLLAMHAVPVSLADLCGGNMDTNQTYELVRPGLRKYIFLKRRNIWETLARRLRPRACLEAAVCTVR